MSRENLADLQAFALVAREKSFARAAAKLGLSRSALSHTINALEKRLGIRLLTRTTRSVSTTDAGARLLATLEPRLADIEAELTALTEFREKPAGMVRISAADYAINMLLWTKLMPLLKSNPDIQLELNMNYGLIDIVAEGFDAGVRAGNLIAKDMVAVLISPNEQLVVAAAPEYLAQNGTPTTPDELTHHSCINLRLPTYGGLAVWGLEKEGKAVNVRVDGRVIVNSTFMVLEATLEGLGIGYIPLKLAEPHFQSGRLVPLLQEWWTSYDAYLYYPKRRQTSSAFAAVLDALRVSPPRKRKTR
ncbi:LysR family transcriptional regulator [Gallibacterium salpingitidis]|uniref:LysR family transcriptional regulator n=1 Tax=Gallibacterium salpingitidis TaxID=505341 RepID=A0A1A7NS74_9PAST|nr:LysR family transcriptional regulator [Gallibacterium salpingitidis]OBW92493.1 LysR family transcriptional regulator [Gallibacterium salpingitidis]